jgi:hypothetical protein
MFVIDSTLLTLAITAIIAVLVASFFMWLGAKIARVERSSYGRSMVAAVAAAFVTWLVSYVGAQIPSMPRVIGFVVGLVLTIVVIQAAYSTRFGKALLVWIFNLIAQVIAGVLAFVLFSYSVLG